MTQQIPNNLRYSKNHEWARSEAGYIVVGITHHAVEQLGDITMITLPTVGDKLVQNEHFGDIDSVKAVAELFAPISGEVVEFNQQLESAPEMINEDPYQKGWMLKVKPSSSDHFSNLMSPQEYANWVEQSE